MYVHMQDSYWGGGGTTPIYNPHKRTPTTICTRNHDWCIALYSRPSRAQVQCKCMEIRGREKWERDCLEDVISIHEIQDCNFYAFYIALAQERVYLDRLIPHGIKFSRHIIFADLPTTVKTKLAIFLP